MYHIFFVIICTQPEYINITRGIWMRRFIRRVADFTTGVCFVCFHLYVYRKFLRAIVWVEWKRHLTCECSETSCTVILSLHILETSSLFTVRNIHNLRSVRSQYDMASQAENFLDTKIFFFSTVRSQSSF